MICDVCGRDNADTLTFCQDCGRRLRVQRVVAPTPPSGVAKVELPVSPQVPPPAASRPGAPSAPGSRDEGRLTPVPSSAPSQRRSRPEVPLFSFKAVPDPPIAVSGMPSHSATSPGGAPSGTASVTSNNNGQAGALKAVICAACRSANPADYRFCVTCGAVLKRSGNMSAERGAPAATPTAPSMPAMQAEPRRVEAPQPAPIPAPAPMRAPEPIPAPPAARSDDKIVGAPVLDIASVGQAPAKFIICARCHGSCVAGTRFCKYCGAPLEEGAARRPGGAAEVARSAPTPSEPDPEELMPPDTRPTERRSQEVALRLEAERRREATSAPEPIPSEPRRAREPEAPSRNAAAAPAGSSGKASASPGRPAPGHPQREDLLEAFPSISEISEPGRRAEISQLAGSPIPSMPVPIAPSRSPSRRFDRKAVGRLVVIVEDGSEGRSFSLGEGQLDVGRVDGDIILEDDHYVSPRHARLRLIDGRWILRDLDSTNHVYVRLRRPHPLRDGDLLLLGLEVLQFQTVSDGERGLGHAMQHGTLLFGSPATPRRARLCQRTVEGVIRDVYHLFRDETVIGREMGDIVFTADPFLSRRHAALRRSATSGEFSLVDLDSSNGTYIAIRGEISLSNGDYLRIGQHLFRVDLG